MEQTEYDVLADMSDDGQEPIQKPKPLFDQEIMERLKERYNGHFVSYGCLMDDDQLGYLIVFVNKEDHKMNEDID